MALEINGDRIDDALIRAEALALRPRCAQLFEEYDPLTAEIHLREMAEERVIERVVLRQQSEQQTASVPADTVDRALGQAGLNCVTPMNESHVKEDTTARLKLDALIGKVIAKVGKPKRKEVVDYYRNHPDAFHSPELIHAAHIVKNVDENTSETVARAAIEELWQQLQSGADFAALADTHSDCPGNGGDLGWFPLGQMVAEFEEVVFGLPVGQISPVFRSPFGFHIARVLDRKPARMQSLDEVQLELHDQLHKRKQRDALESYVAELRRRAVIRRVK